MVVSHWYTCKNALILSDPHPQPRTCLECVATIATVVLVADNQLIKP